MNTTIGKGITITGSIQASEPVTIAGTVNGDVLASDFDVTVEAGARVDGAVTARSITVRGRSTGRLIAREMVRVLQSAAVRGDVAAPKLSLEDGRDVQRLGRARKGRCRDDRGRTTATRTPRRDPRKPNLRGVGHSCPHLHEILGKPSISCPSSTIMAATV